MAGKHFDLDTRTNLGGEQASDITIASQKATKSYIDTEVGKKQNTLTAGTGISISGDTISAAATISDLTDTTITSPSDGQVLKYNGSKWINSALAIPSQTSDLNNNSGFITKDVNNLTNYTDNATLSSALSGKANISHTHGKADITDFPTKVSAFTNDAGYLTEHQDISGKQDKIDVDHKLSSDLVDDTNKTHKFVTSAQMSTWSGKQDAISDLETIRIGAGKGATAVQPGDNISELVNDAGYLTSEDIASVFVYKGTKAQKTDLPSSGNKKGDVWTVSVDGAEYVWDGSDWQYLGQIMDLSGYVPTSRTINGKTLTSNISLTYSDVNALSSSTFIPTVTDTYNASSTNAMSGKAVASAISGKQDTINDLATIRANASEGASANATIATYGDIVTHNASEFLTEHQDITGKADISSLSDVAFSGSYNDLDNKPSIPTTYSDIGAASANHTHNYVPTSRKINGKTLTNDISLIYSDVSASSSAHTHTYSDVGAASASHTHDYVPTSRKVNGKTLNADVTLTYSDIGAASTSHSHSDLVPNTRKVAGKALSADVTLSTTDITGLSDALSAKANITETYTKSEIDGKLSGAMHFKGTVTKVSNLPASGNQTGDMYNVTETGANYAWDGSAWDKLSENIDLSGLVPNTRKINGKTLNADITLTYSDVGASSSSHTHSNYVPTSRTVNGKTLSNNISLTYSDVSAASSAHTHSYSDVGAASASHTHTYSDVGAASSSHTHSNYVVNTRKINGKTLNADITLTYSDVNALSASTVIPTVPTNVSAFNNDAGYLVSSDISGKQDKDTAVTHTKNTAVGNTITPVYVNSSGVATALGYTIAKSVPADAKFSDTTYTAGSGLSLSGTQFKHKNSVTSGTAGTNAATSGSTLAVPYVTYDTEGHITATGTHTHTVTGFLTAHQDISGKANISELADVAFSGSYADLSNKPSYSDVGAASASHTHSNYVPTSRKVNGKTLNADITLSYSDVGASSSSHTHTYSDVGAASSAHTHTYSDVGAASATHTHNYVPTSRTVNGKTLSADISLTYSDVSAASSGHNHDSSYAAKNTAVTHTASTTVGSTVKPIYVASDGKATALSATVGSTIKPIYLNGGAITELSYTIAKSVPSDAKFSDTTYTAGSGLSLSGTQFKHKNSVTSGTAGTNAGTSGSTLAVPYVTYDTEGHITATGTHTHTITGFLTSHQDISGKANVTETYTKSEIDGKLASGMHFKGTVTSATALPTQSNQTGDMYNVTDTGANYAWDGTAWDKLSENVDLSGLVPNTRKVNNKALNVDISLTYSDVGAASSGHTHAYVPTSRKVNGKTLSADISLTYSDVGASSSGHTHSDYQPKLTAVTHTSNTAVGNTITPVYIASDGTATALSYTIAKSVPADANFSNTTYSAGTDLSLSGTTFNHKASGVTAGTAGTSTATSGSTLSVPYVTYNAQGHVTAAGTHTHTVTGFVPTSRTVNGKTLSANISLTYSDVGASSSSHTHTYSDVGAASSGHTHSNYVPTTRAVNGKTLSADITLTYSDVSAASSGHTHDYQPTSTAVSHTASTAVGSTIKPIYVASNGAATAFSANIGNTITPLYMASGELKALSYTIAKSVPADANFSNTTYTAGTDLSLSGTTFNHKASGITAGTTGTSAATSGSTLAVPYVTYNAQGHLTAAGTHTHTVTGFVPTTTGVTHTASTAVGNTITPVYVASNGTATALSYTIAKSVPSNAVFTDTNNAVTNTLNTTTKAYITGSTNAATNTGGQIFDTGVYLTTTAGKFNANTLSLGSENAMMQYNSTTEAIEFVFA